MTDRPQQTPANDDDTADLADREIGFQAFLDGEPLDALCSDAWKQGWQDAQTQGEY